MTEHQGETLTKTTKSSVDKVLRQALRRRVCEVTGCRKQPVIRSAVQLLLPQVRKQIESGSTRSVDQLVNSLPAAHIDNAVSHAGRLESRKRNRRRRNRKVRRQVHLATTQYRGQRGAATAA